MPLPESATAVRALVTVARSELRIQGRIGADLWDALELALDAMMADLEAAEREERRLDRGRLRADRDRRAHP